MWSSAKIRSSDHTLSLKAVASFHVQTEKPKLLFFHFPYRTFIKLNGFFSGFLLVCSISLLFFFSRTQAHIEDFDETQLKSLLDEAMDYKNPRDANDKSEAFKVSSVIASFMFLLLRQNLPVDF